MALPDMDAVFQGSDDGCGDAVPGELASVRVLACAVDKDPEDMLDPDRADPGVERAFGLSSLDEVEDGIAGRDRPVWRPVAFECARIAENEHQAVPDRDHRGDRPAHGVQRRALIQCRLGDGLADRLDRVLDGWGSVLYLHSQRHLFAGDALAWSLTRLARSGHHFEHVFPGHGDWTKGPVHDMSDRLARLT
jgi:hypothetical protein